MLTRIVSLFILSAIFISTFNQSGAAQSIAAGDPSIGSSVSTIQADETQKNAETKTVSDKKISKFAVLNPNSESGANQGSMLDFKTPKAPVRRLSNSSKVLIGVGIAAALAGVFYFAASRDKIRPFK